MRLCLPFVPGSRSPFFPACSHSSAPLSLQRSLPNLLKCTDFGNPTIHQTSIAPNGGSPAVKGGLETYWQIEFGTTGSGPWTPVAGCNGTITEVEAKEGEDRHVDCVGEAMGLTGGTTYYFRFVVKNSAGEASQVESVATSPLYPRVGSAPGVSDATAISAHLTTDVKPENFETHWHFEYAEAKEGPWKDVSGADGTITAAEANEEPHEVEGDLGGLSAEKTYYVRVFAENEHGEGKVLVGEHESVENGVINYVAEEEPMSTATHGILSFETGGPPDAVTFAAHGIDVVGEAMRALGSVKPHGYDAHYYVEYVTQSQFEAGGWAEAQRTLPADAGSGEFTNGAFPTTVVGVDLPGLLPGVSYRYRLVVSSVAPGDPVVDGGERALTVPVSGQGEEGVVEGASSSCPNEAERVGASAALPDCRAYELVTPPEKGGAQDVFKYGATAEGSLVGLDGDHFVLHAPGVEWGPHPATKVADYFFARNPEKGWEMTSVRPLEDNGPTDYRPVLFNSDLTLTALAAEWETSIASKSKEVSLEWGAPGGPYASLVTLPRNGFSEGSEPAERALVAASGDFGKLIFRATDREVIPGVKSHTKSGLDLYEATAGGVRQVNVGAGVCGAYMVHGYEEYEGGTPEDFGGGGIDKSAGSSSHAVSGDGARVFYEAAPGSDCAAPVHLYEWLNGEETVDIGAYRFLAANPEGTRLLLEKQNSGTYEFLLYDTETGKSELLFTAAQPAFETAASTVNRGL